MKRLLKSQTACPIRVLAVGYMPGKAQVEYQCESGHGIAAIEINKAEELIDLLINLTDMGTQAFGPGFEKKLRQAAREPYE